ncbi:LamG domain-containing protein [Actinoplanes sp. NPDC023936]|uniref:LamG domain-containing protein n=1 Tax=Actinoplanes sp. NPDC023936 TaxID=3154910 RepID=UPI0033CCA997
MRKRTAIGTVLLSAATVVLVAPIQTASADPLGPAPETAPTEGAAVAAAEKYGERVEALSERTEFSQVFAEPTGELRYEAAAVPQFVHRADGSWDDIDTNLKSGADGQLRPVATLADVRFSDGGDEPLVKLVRDGETMTMSWPLGELPEPSVAGDSATYAEVLPDVDLVVRATRTGFTHVVVVKSADAAANPKIRELRFDLGGDAKVTTLPNGSLRAATDTTILAVAEVPQMWDSRQPGQATLAARSAQEAPLDTHSNVPESTHEAPGDAAQIAPLETEIDGKGDLILRPDERLLGEDATFPVFIDPPWDTAKKRWAYATNNNSNNTDTSVARVGADPESGKIYRSFFEFPTTAIAGKYVRSAYVQMKLDHSYSCDPSWTHLYHSGVLTTPRTSWSTRLITHLASAESNANEGAGCSDSPQPDQTINFINDNTISPLVRNAAAKKYSTITFGFSAGNASGEYESSVSRWKKWFPEKARLITNVDAYPGTPTGLQVSGIYCSTNSATPATIGTLTPQFSAVMPDADGDDGDNEQAIRATWSFKRVNADGTRTTLTAPTSGPVPANTRTTTGAVSTLVAGTTYVITVMGTDPAPYNLESPWAPDCYFKVDNTVPKDVTITQLVAPTGAGTTAKYRFSSTSSDVATFRYGWEEARKWTVAAVTKDGLRTADVEVTVPAYGLNVLYLYAIDNTQNKASKNADVNVPRPRDAVARWALETSPSVDRVEALSDRQTALGTPAVSTLTATGVTWTGKGHVIGAENVTLAGAGVLKAAKLLDTTKSFSAAAWVKLDSLDTHQNVISQDGANTSNFQLMYRYEDRTGDGVKDKSWCFGFRPSDTTSQAWIPSCVVNTVVADRWTHIAGTYDATTKTVAVWVNGVRGPEVAVATAWASNGAYLRIGNSKYTSTTDTDWLRGSVVDAQVFDRVLVQGDFVGKLDSDFTDTAYAEPGILEATRVAKWGAEKAVACIEGPTTLRNCVDIDAGSGTCQVN